MRLDGIDVTMNVVETVCTPSLLFCGNMCFDLMRNVEEIKC